MSVGKDFFDLIQEIKYNFKNNSYLENALTHTSYSNERKGRGSSYPSNERLEFLGDAVLQILISEYLYENFKTKTEGTLTKMRQFLVCEKTLYQVANSIKLGEYLNVGHGEELTDCRKRPKVLADALEALIAAIYLDSDKFADHAGRVAVLSLFEEEIKKCETVLKQDYKTMLQQLVEKDGSAVLEYVVLHENGPDHKKIFTVEAKINNNTVGVGTATTKKDAEMQAAKGALNLFGINV